MSLFASIGIGPVRIGGSIGGGRPRATPQVRISQKLTRQAGNATLTVQTVRLGSQIMHYTLHVIENGHDREVTQAHTYPEILGKVQLWTQYLKNGGTLHAWAWNAHNQSKGN